MSIHILNKKHGISAGKLIADTAMSFDRKKQRRHKLFILTCYVDLDLIEDYLKYILNTVRITNVYLAFNFAEIYKKGPAATIKQLATVERILEKKKIEFEWKTLASSKLVHSKAYALIQSSGDATVTDGVVLTTSANFTKPGFKGENIEIGYLSIKKKDINGFKHAYNYLWDELGRDLGKAIFKQENYLLKFALLSSGVFLHKWTGNLSQQVGIKYVLTPLAKERGTIAPELAAVGFEAGSTFTRQVLKLDALPKKEVPKQFITSFTIETYLGRWCPLEAWTTLSKSFEGAAEFIQKFEAETEESVLLKLVDEALAVQNDLVEKGLIKPVSQDHIVNWASRITELRSNSRRLERFFMGYNAHKLPYTVEQKSDVLELFDSLEEAIELTKSKNIAKKKLDEAKKNSNPELLLLSENEKQKIKSMRNEA